MDGLCLIKIYSRRTIPQISSDIVRCPTAICSPGMATEVAEGPLTVFSIYVNCWRKLVNSDATSTSEKVGCTPKLVSLIRRPYTNVETNVIIDGELSNLFQYNSGVKQGCKLAPTFYGIYAAILLWVAFKDINHEHSVLVRFRTDGNFFDLEDSKLNRKPSLSIFVKLNMLTTLPLLATQVRDCKRFSRYTILPRTVLVSK